MSFALVPDGSGGVRLVPIADAPASSTDELAPSHPQRVQVPEYSFGLETASDADPPPPEPSAAELLAFATDTERLSYANEWGKRSTVERAEWLSSSDGHLAELALAAWSVIPRADEPGDEPTTAPEDATPAEIAFLALQCDRRAYAQWAAGARAAWAARQPRTPSARASGHGAGLRGDQ